MEPKPSKIPTNATQNQITFPHTTADNCNVDASDHRRRKLEHSMDKFREAVMKIATSVGPLKATRQMLIEERLRDFFTDFHTPDHPTYSAMIHRAIGDLNEEGGSSEESISEFIRKQYVDLPWAHSTLLKHHLGKLCEGAEIVVTSDQRYLLADVITNTNPSVCFDPKRQQMKQKSGGKKKQSRGRSKKRKKDKFHEENQRKEEQMEVIGEKIDLTETLVEVIGGQYQVREEHDGMTVIENQVEEQQSEVIESQSKEPQNRLIGQNQQQEHENGVCEGQKQLIEQQNYMVNEQNQTPEQQPEVIEEKDQPLEQEDEVTEGKNDREQQIDIDPELNMIETQQKEQQGDATDDQSQLDGQQNEGDSALIKQPESQPKIKSSLLPEPQPQLMITSLDLPGASLQLDLHRKLDSSNPDICCQQKLTEPYVKTMTTSFDILMNSQQQQQRNLDHQHKGLPESQPTTMILPPPTTVTTFDLPRVSQLFEQEQQPEFPNSEGPQGLSGQQMPQPVLGKPPVVELATLEEVDELSHTLQKMREEQRQLRHQCQKHSEGKPVTEATAIELFPLQHQHQQPEVLNSEGLQLRNSTEMEESSEVQQQAKQSGRRKWTKSMLKAIITQGVPVSSEQLEQKQLSELTNPEKSPDIELTTMDPLSEEQKQLQKICGKRKALESQTAMVASFVAFPKFSEHQPDISVPEEPIELERATMELSSLTERMQRQIKRWSRVIPECKPAITPCARSQELNQAPVEESTQSTQQQTELCGWQKLPISQPKTMIDSLDSPPSSQQQELEQKQEVPSPERPQVQQNQQPQENLQLRQLRSRLPGTQLVMAKTMADLDPSPYQHEKQQQPESRGRGRPSKPKADTATTGGELSPSDHQNQHEQQQAIKSSAGARKFIDTCGLQAQQQPELPSVEMSHELKPVEELPTTQDQQQQQRAQEKPQQRRLCPWSLNLEAAKARDMTELLSSQLQYEGQQQTDRQQPKRRGRGRPCLPKSDTATTVEESLPVDHQHQQQPERQGRGRGRSPKLKPETDTAKEGLLPSGNQHNPKQHQQEEEKPKRRGRGRPPKPKPDTDAIIETLSLQKLQC